MDCAFKAVKGLGTPSNGHLDRLVVLIATAFAFTHESPFLSCSPGGRTTDIIDQGRRMVSQMLQPAGAAKGFCRRASRAVVLDSVHCCFPEHVQPPDATR
jgi:hypothetical protein